MLQHLRAEQLALAVLFCLSGLAQAEVPAGSSVSTSARGLSPAFHTAVPAAAAQEEKTTLSRFSSPQDIREPRSVGKVLQGSTSPKKELRKSSLPSKELNVDTRMHFFSIPVGAKPPQEMKKPALRVDDTMKFYSIPVGSRQVVSTNAEDLI